MIKLVIRHISQQEIKKTAMSALEEYKNFVFEVDSINVWLSQVMKSQAPIVLQAYANWSLPCRKLTPLIQKKALMDEGKWLYARLDIDEMNELASALEVIKVPALFLVNKGNVMNRVEGIITEEALNEFIEDAKLLAGLVSDETVFQGLLSAGEEFVKEKKYNEAIRAFQEALSYKQYAEVYKTQCWEGLLSTYYMMGDAKKVEECLKVLEGGQQVSQKAQEVRGKIEEKKGKESEVCKKIEEIKGRVEGNPGDFEGFAELAWVYHENGRSEEAIKVALELIEKEKSFKGLGQKVVVRILNELGNDHLLTKPARKKMQSLLIKYS